MCLHVFDARFCRGLNCASSGIHRLQVAFSLTYVFSLYVTQMPLTYVTRTGNGLSDKPQLFSSRSTKWNIDDYVEKDVPAIIRFVLKETKTQQVHFLGHSMVRHGVLVVVVVVGIAIGLRLGC